MLDMNQINSAMCYATPFKYAVIKNLLHPEVANSLLNSLPQEGNYRSLRKSGSDKVYNVVNNILLELGQDDYNKSTNLQCQCVILVQQLQSAPYREALSNLLSEDVTKSHIEITLKRYGYNDYISAHTDKEHVTGTHMIFLNQTWEMNWGGLLHFMHPNQEDFQVFLPTVSSSVAFVRSEISWHRVCPVLVQNKERVALQVAFWNKVIRTVEPGRYLEPI